MAVSGAWTYTESGGNATITDYDTGIGGFTPTIPTTLDTFPVIAIADGAMESKSLTSVTIDHSLDLVGDAIANNGTLTVTINANLTTSSTTSTACPFRNCTIGTNLTLGASVTSIPRYLFGYSGLSSVTLTNITTIGAYSFSHCSITSVNLDHAIELTTESFSFNTGLSITLDANVTTTGITDIAYSPFEDCAVGTNLTITTNVTTIPDYLFGKCGLTAVTIASTVTSVGKNSFRQNSLTALTIPTALITISDYAFRNNSISSLTLGHVMDLGDECFGYNGNIAVTMSAQVTTSGVISESYPPFEGCTIGTGLTISSGITSIPNYLFCNCGLTSVTIASTVTSVGRHSFSSNSLTALTIPTALVTISDYAFKSNSITSLTLGHVMDLGDECFGYNGNISVTLSADVTTSAVQAEAYAPFEGCTIGTGLTISSGVTTIPNFLFGHCGLTSVSFPSTVTTVGTWSFCHNSLTALTIPTALVTINNYAFLGNTISSLTLDHAIDFGRRAFGSNSGLSVTLDANVTTTLINTTAYGPFYQCGLGSNVTITSNVTSIPNYLFDTAQLTSITFPSTVTTLGNSVLYDNDDLSTIIFEANETVTFGTGILTGSQPSPKGTIYGYDSSVETWAAGFSTYYDFSYDVPGGGSYTANFSNSMYNSSKFSKVIEFLA